MPKPNHFQTLHIGYRGERERGITLLILGQRLNVMVNFGNLTVKFVGKDQKFCLNAVIHFQTSHATSSRREDELL